MTKSEAIKIFGSGAEMARALMVTASAVSQWPERLTQRQIDQVVGAAVRLGLAVPVADGEADTCAEGANA
jgi:hypothetical protein